ncbi:CHC2 zinc finger domain-containing protein [Bacillus sp. Brlt_9]|uniref:CHC2 zinc finger domain-containing protein n=1 Tax=Bacillus sp. Brlt_9 TaxID=3110916 RepID=UPI003F7BA6C9
MNTKNIDTYRFLSLICEDSEEVVEISVYSDPAKVKYPKHFSFKLSELNKELHHWTGTYKRKNDGKELPYYFKTNNTTNKEGVFFVVNGGGTKKEEIDKIRAFFIDVDFAKEKIACTSEEEAKHKQAEYLKTNKYVTVEVECTKAKKWYVKTRKTNEEIQGSKDNFLATYKEELKDSLIVETFSGFHIYWLVSDCSIEMFEKVESALIGKFGSDPQVKNRSRILRIPGFLHQKYEEPFLITVIQWSERRFTVAEFTSELGINLEKKRQEKGYVKTTEQEEVAYNSKVTRGVSKVEHSGRTASIVFHSPQPVKEKCTRAKAIEEILSRPLTDFVKEPVMIQDTAIHCPFHNDSNPSASVFRSRKGEEAFYCHSCNIGARNAIGLYMAKTGAKYTEAINKLARMIGIKIVRTEWEQDMLEIYQSNREFLEDDIETYYPSIHKFISKYARVSYLRHFNDKGGVKILSEDISYKGHNVFFVSIRYLKGELNKKSTRTVHSTVLLLCLLGFLERVPDKEVPEEMRNRAKTETEILKKELKAQGEEGENRSKGVRDINFYIIKSWSDDAYEMESIAAELIEKGFSISVHLNKTGLTKLMGVEVANRVFPDNRKVAKQYSALEEKIIELVEKEIGEYGFCVIENIISQRVRYQQDTVRVKATKEQKEDIFKRSLNDILGESYKVVRVRNKEKKKMFGFDKESYKVIRVIIPK